MRINIPAATIVPPTTLAGLSLAFRRASVALSAVFFLLIGTAQAEECGVRSPLLTDRGDDYYSLPDSVSRSHTDVATLDTLLDIDSSVIEKLTSARFARGHGHRTTCFGTVNNRRVEIAEIELEDIRVVSDGASDRSTYSRVSNGFDLPGNIIINADEYDTHKKVLRQESIHFPLFKDESVTTVADAVLETNSRLRQDGEQGSFLRESAITASLTANGISVTEKIYVNGYLAEWLTWNLETR